MKLSRRQRRELDLIEDTLQTLDENRSVNFEKDIKKLARKENEIKAILVFKNTYESSDIKYVEELQKRVDYVLTPIFEKITDTAFNHFMSWFSSINSEDEKPVELSPTQMKMAYWILYRIIRKKSISDIYSVLMPRGGGKSYIIAAIGIFLMLNHDKYLINKKDNKYSILITSPSEHNLTQFLAYIRDFVERAVLKVENDFDLSRNNDELVRIKKNHLVFGEVYFRLANKNAKSIEGLKSATHYTAMCG